MIEKIYNKTSCSLTIDGDATYPVAAFTLALEENTIPTITVTISGYTIPDNSSYSVKKPTIKDHMELYNKFQGLCTKGTKASFNFSAVDVTNTDPQTIAISNWICTGAGFGRLTARGVIALTVTLKHPIYQLYYSTMRLGGTTKFDSTKWEDAVKNTKNPLEGLIAGLEAYVATTGEGTDDDSKKKYNDAIAILKDQVDTTNLSYPKMNSTLLPGIKDSMWLYVIYATSDNLWNFICGSFMPEWFLSLKPTYTGKISLSPFEPWGPKQLDLNVNTMDFIELPSEDPNPIRSAYTTIRIKKSTGYTAYRPKLGDNLADTLDKDERYTEPDVIGSEVALNMPSWFSHAISYTKPDTSTSAFMSDSDVTTTDQAKLKVDQLLDNKVDLQKIVKGFFLTRYRQSVSLTCSMKLTTHINGTAFIPGSVCAIIDGTDELIRIYVTSVLHHVNVGQRTARTEVGARYVRNPALTVMAKQEVTSPLYT